MTACAQEDFMLIILAFGCQIEYEVPLKVKEA